MSNDTTTSSDTPDDAQPINNDRTSTAADHDDAPDTAAELARWKQIARKHEDRAKANADAAKELDKLRAASMTDLERVIAETKSTTRLEVLREVGTVRVADQVRLAAAGRQIDVDAVLEALNLERFMDSEAQPDVKAIQAYVDRIAPPPAEIEAPNPRVPFGVRTTTSTAADPAQEFAAFRRRQLNG